VQAHGNQALSGGLLALFTGRVGAGKGLNIMQHASIID
jgi:hypothetical protein